MKQFFKTPFLALLVVAVVAFNACNPDDPIVINPVISLESGTDVISEDMTVPAGTTLNFILAGSKGDNPLQAVTFEQDGTSIEISRITINGQPAATASVLLFDTDKDGFNWNVSITPHATGTATYTFILGDDKLNSSRASVDVTIEDAPAPPIVTLSGGSSIMLEAGTKALVKLNADAQGRELSTIAVYQEGVLITDLSRLEFEDVSFDANPYTLAAADMAGFTDGVLTIRAQQESGTIKNYTIEIANSLGETGSTSVALSTNTSFTVNDMFNGILISNNAGQNFGGMNLYTGMSESTATGNPHIVDQGIDSNLPISQNWLQEIAPDNGASLKVRSQSQIDAGLNFASINTYEQLRSEYDSASPIGSSVKVVAVGDVFLANISNDYFVFECTNINVTPNDNLDSYTFDIKKAEF